MADYQNDCPGEDESRAHGKTLGGDRIVDMNTPAGQEIAVLPTVRKDRARRIREARQFESPEDAEANEGLGGMRT